MTAINFWVLDDCIHCFSDGLSYEDDGTIVAITPKVFPLSHINAAIAASGSVALARVVRTIAEVDYHSFDALAVALPDILAKAKKLFPDEKGRAYVAGMSEKAGKFVVVHATSDAVFGGKPGELVEINVGNHSLMPYDADVAEYLEQHGIVDIDADDIDPSAVGPVLIRAQRSLPFEWVTSNDNKFRAVGGFTQHTLVTRDAVTTRIVERFPLDQIGSKVGEPTHGMLGKAFAEAYAAAGLGR